MSIKTKILCMVRRIGLKNRNFTIISNNCWGGSEYSYYGLKYLTPFAGLFLREDDYVKLCENFDGYINLPLEFVSISQSKYAELRENSYPMAMLGDLEVHFMHYKNAEEAKTKWDRRKKRINKDNILFKLSERTDCCSEEIQKRFLSLPYNNVILFTQNKNIADNDKRAVFVPELKNITIGSENSIIRKHINTKLLYNNMKK